MNWTEPFLPAQNLQMEGRAVRQERSSVLCAKLQIGVGWGKIVHFQPLEARSFEKGAELWGQHRLLLMTSSRQFIKQLLPGTLLRLYARVGAGLDAPMSLPRIDEERQYSSV